MIISIFIEGIHMNQNISIIVFFVIFQLIFLIVRQQLKIKSLKSQRKQIERSYNRWETYYTNHIQILECKIDELMKQTTSKTSKVSKDTIQAIKYAMKHAHPDNGGNAEDFIRFQKCYEELTKK